MSSSHPHLPFFELFLQKKQSTTRLQTFELIQCEQIKTIDQDPIESLHLFLQAVKYIKQNLAISTDTLGSELLINCAKTSMSSKIVGSDSDFFAKIAVEAIQSVKVQKDNGKATYPVGSINILKAHGKSMKESRLIRGYAITTGRASQVVFTLIPLDRLFYFLLPLFPLKNELISTGCSHRFGFDIDCILVDL